MTTKRVLSVIVILLSMTLLITSCARNRVSQQNENEPATEADRTTEGTTPNEEESVFLREQVIYEIYGITISVMKYEEVVGDHYIWFQVLNSSDTSVYVDSEQMSINGQMAPSITLNTGAARWRTTSQSMRIGSSFLKDAGIETISELQFYLTITNAKTNDVMAKSELITVRLSETYEQQSGITAPILYETDAFKIAAELRHPEDPFGSETLGYELKLQMGNSSGRTVIAVITELSINGSSVPDGMWTCLVLRDGTIAATTCPLYGAAELTDITLNFTIEVMDNETGEQILETPVLSIINS